MSSGAQGIFDDFQMWPADFLWGGRDKAPIFGDRFDDKYEEGMVDALRQAQEQYAEYRPEVAQGRTYAMNQALNMFSPANNQLAEMYGPQAKVELGVDNPLAGLFSER